MCSAHQVQNSTIEKEKEKKNLLDELISLEEEEEKKVDEFMRLP